MSIKDASDVVFELLIIPLDLETLASVVLLTKAANRLVETKKVLTALAKKYQIEPVNSFLQTLKNISRRIPNQWSTLYRHPNWCLKKAMRNDDQPLADNIYQRYQSSLSDDVIVHYKTYLKIRQMSHPESLLDEHQLDAYRFVLIELARLKIVVSQYKLSQLHDKVEMKYRINACKTGDLGFIKQIECCGLAEELKVTHYLGRPDLNEYVFTQMWSRPPKCEIIYFFLRGGHLEHAKEISDSSVEPIYTANGQILLGALYSMNIDCINYALELGSLNMDFMTRLEFQDIGKSPGETTPKKLLRIKELFLKHGYDVTLINKIFLKFIIDNDDVDSVETLVQEFELTEEDIMKEAHNRNASSISKCYPSSSIIMEDEEEENPLSQPIGDVCNIM
ncbi:Hypothetical protein POVR1_LOCUS6 [uncultured virus]|nr:Hypothetical protein POVR1_LOCUS6 [uncultured virus]